jgi:hypothetical protein
MRYKKIFRDSLQHCYAVMHLKQQDRDFLVVASEEDAPCYAYDLADGLRRQEVWRDVGGTMTMVQVPGTLDFLAIQRFYPGFRAEGCRLVLERFDGTGWEQSIVAQMPYVHRFDIVPRGEAGKYWYIACSVAGTKASPDDWSNPGRVFVGTYDHRQGQFTAVRALKQMLTKNHGYYRADGQHSFVAAAEGIYRLSFPGPKRDWGLEKVSGRESSDIVACDINADGQEEYMAIEGFHGHYLRFYDNAFRTMCVAEVARPFGHALWGGKIYGQPCFIFGYRAGDQELLEITYKDGQFRPKTIDRGVGTSNVLVYEREGRFYLLAAHREIDEIALYEINR